MNDVLACRCVVLHFFRSVESEQSCEGDASETSDDPGKFTNAQNPMTEGYIPEIAIIGAGPAGLMAADVLSQKKHSCHGL